MSPLEAFENQRFPQPSAFHIQEDQSDVVTGSLYTERWKCESLEVGNWCDRQHSLRVRLLVAHLQGSSQHSTASLSSDHSKVAAFWSVTLPSPQHNRDRLHRPITLPGGGGGTKRMDGIYGKKKKKKALYKRTTRWMREISALKSCCARLHLMAKHTKTITGNIMRGTTH